METITGKEAVKNIKYLVRMLHREWGRSGRTSADVCMDEAERRAVGIRIAEEIRERQKQLESEGMTFRQCMELTKENYILLRLAGKIKKAGDRAGRRADALSFTVEMDREEYRMFSALMEVQEE